MKNLLNLLAAIALLIWGTYLVRTGIFRVFGSALRNFLSRNLQNRFSAAVAGLGITALVQSSTATVLLISSFVGQGWVALPLALAVALGADIGASLMAVAFSFDLSWLSPLLLLSGVILFLSNEQARTGRVGRILIGLGLMLLALSLIRSATQALTQAPAIQALLTSLSGDRFLPMVMGAVLAIFCYSSLAVVLLTATLASSSVMPLEIALGLVLGANLGSGILAVLNSIRSAGPARQVPIGNLVFKSAGVAVSLPLLEFWVAHFPHIPAISQPIAFHLFLNVLIGVLFLGPVFQMARWIERWGPTVKLAHDDPRPRHLDPSALATPSLAISCAVREAMHQADVVETMLRGLLTVIRTNDLQLSQSLRKMEDQVDALYSAIKHYLTQISREALGEEESRRWTDIIGFTINMEQIGDIVERALQDVEEKKIRSQRSFSDAGMEEISALHERLISNFQLGVSVFLHGSVADAQSLLTEKVYFREMERHFSSNHLLRLSEKTQQSVETSSLHIDLLSELRRANSHICSFAYPILDSIGALTPSRLKSVPPA